VIFSVVVGDAATITPSPRGLETKRDEAWRTCEFEQQGRGPAEGRVALRNQQATAAADGLCFGKGDKVRQHKPEESCE